MLERYGENREGRPREAEKGQRAEKPSGTQHISVTSSSPSKKGLVCLHRESSLLCLSILSAFKSQNSYSKHLPIKEG